MAFFDIRRSHFDTWLLNNYGFNADLTPISKKPPLFITPNGIFDYNAEEKWTDNIKKIEYLKTLK